MNQPTRVRAELLATRLDPRQPRMPSLGHLGRPLQSWPAGDDPEPLGELGVEMPADDRRVWPGGQMDQGGLSVVVLVTAQLHGPPPVTLFS